MNYSYRRVCYSCKDKCEGCVKGCEKKLIDDFYYAEYKKEKETNRLFSLSKPIYQTRHQTKAMKPTNRNNHWLEAN